MSPAEKIKVDQEVYEFFKKSLSGERKSVAWYGGVLFASFLYKNRYYGEMSDILDTLTKREKQPEEAENE